MKTKDEMIEEIIQDQNMWFENMCAFLSRDELRDFQHKQLHWLMNVAIFNQFLRREEEEKIYPRTYLNTLEPKDNG